MLPDIAPCPELHGNGITSACSKAAAFDSPYTPVASAIDIKAKYDAKNGAPSAGAPKVFFKYFYVNTATGEKSGEKMLSAVLNEFNLDGKTVQVTPMAGFYATKGMGKRQVRLAYVIKEPDLIEACRCLKAGLEAYPHRIK